MDKSRFKGILKSWERFIYPQYRIQSFGLSVLTHVLACSRALYWGCLTPAHQSLLLTCCWWDHSAVDSLTVLKLQFKEMKLYCQRMKDHPVFSLSRGSLPEGQSALHVLWKPPCFLSVIDVLWQLRSDCRGCFSPAGFENCCKLSPLNLWKGSSIGVLNCSDA